MNHKKFPWAALVILVLAAVAILVYYSLGGTFKSTKIMDSAENKPTQPSQIDNTLPSINSLEVK